MVESMNVNPYQPPTGGVSAAEESSDDLQGRRPVGVAILAILYGIGSLGFLVLLIFLTHSADNEEWFAAKGIPWIWFAGIGVVFVALGFSTTIGLWMGARWSWWTACWYHFFSATGDFFRLIFVCVNLAGVSTEDAVVFVTPRVVALAFQTAITAYFFSQKVLTYFGLTHLSRLQALAKLTAVSIIFILAVAALVAYNAPSLRPR
jgi:hypothetical protein